MKNQKCDIKILQTKLREDILSNIIEKNGVTGFKNKPGGDCAMLDSDGLCRIQRNTEEKMLCNTCRKYPRITVGTKERKYISMAASCPVIIRYLLYEKLEWKVLDYDTGHSVKNEIQAAGSSSQKFFGFDIYAEINKITQKLTNIYRVMPNQKEVSQDIKNDKMYNYSMNIVDNVIDMVLKYPDCKYLSGSFEIFEEYISKENFNKIVFDFQNACMEIWRNFCRNYIEYRLAGRYMEHEKECSEERIIQVEGELLLIFIISLSRYKTKSDISMGEEKDYTEFFIQTIHWVYRLAVHGESSSVELHDVFLKLSKDV